MESIKRYREVTGKKGFRCHGALISLYFKKDKHLSRQARSFFKPPCLRRRKDKTPQITHAFKK